MQAGLPFLVYKEEHGGVVSDFQGCVFWAVDFKAIWGALWLAGAIGQVLFDRTV